MDLVRQCYGTSQGTHAYYRRFANKPKSLAPLALITTDSVHCMENAQKAVNAGAAEYNIVWDLNLIGTGALRGGTLGLMPTIFALSTSI